MITTQNTTDQKKLLATSYRLSNLGQCRSKKDHWSCEHEGSYVSISTLAEANILNFWEVTLVCIEKTMESLFHTSDRYLTNFGAKRIIKVPYFSRLKTDSHIKLDIMKSENDFKNIIHSKKNITFTLGNGCKHKILSKKDHFTFLMLQTHMLV